MGRWLGMRPSAPKTTSTISAATTMVANISAVMRRAQAAVVLAVGGDDREHDEVGEDEGHHARPRALTRAGVSKLTPLGSYEENTR